MKPAKKPSEEPSPYEGAGNPYNTAGEVPCKKKLSWDDAPVGTRAKDR